MKTCTNCLKAKDLKDFERRETSRPNSYRTQCKECENTKRRNRRRPVPIPVKTFKNPRYKDLTGQKFGRLRVIEFSHRNKKNKLLWKCLCECGMMTHVRGEKLTCTKKRTKSCGCLQRQTPSHISKKISDRNLDRFLFTNKEEYQSYLYMSYTDGIEDYF
jgi:hypothetical protein